MRSNAYKNICRNNTHLGADALKHFRKKHKIILSNALVNARQNMKSV